MNWGALQAEQSHEVKPTTLILGQFCAHPHITILQMKALRHREVK